MHWYGHLIRGKIKIAAARAVDGEFIYDVHIYIDIYVGIFLVLAGLCIYGRWDGQDACKILVWDVGTSCSYFWEIRLSTNMITLMQYLWTTIVCSSLCFLLCSKQSATGKMSGLTMGSFHGFHKDSYFDIVFTSQIRAFMQNLLSRFPV